MSQELGRSELEAMIRAGAEHARARTIAQTDDVLALPAARYTDPEIFAAEVKRIFRRLPLMLAASAELPEPGDFKTLMAAGVPVLITRGADGEARAFVNTCSHRGAQVVVEAKGNARRFTCPYHGWTFSGAGELMGVAAADDFGDVDRGCLGLPPLQCCERAGLIWVNLDPEPKVSFDAFLAGYDRLLGNFGFANWRFFQSRVIRGPNWKIAYDGYLDFYHLPVLHKATFGEAMSNRALYYAWGPHQRVQAPSDDLAALAALPETDRTVESMLGGVWTIFPHISIASFDRGGRAVMISQLLPGAQVGESFTTQIYLTEKVPDAAGAAELDAQFKFLEHVVRDEDYATGLRQQEALESGLRPTVLFGRNEGGAQRFHGWVDRVLAADDADLAALFSAP